MQFSLICFVLLLCYCSADVPDFIDLSAFSYSTNDVLGDIKIQFKSTLPDITMKIECAQCNIKTNQWKIICQGNEILQFQITLEKGDKTIKIPFNATCDKHSVNEKRIQNIMTINNVNDIIILWNPPSDDVMYYLLHFMDTTGSYSHRIINKASPYTWNGLHERSWYQICLASIDNNWTTSTFTCKQILTDFSITGPVTNITANADEHAIYLSWHKPQYQYDIPEGYTVHVKADQGHLCRTIIISMKDNDPITNKDQICHQEPDRQSWTQLQQLKINDLPAYSKFTINIIPHNKGKQGAPQSISIDTKQGESSAVRQLEIKHRSKQHIWIGFKEPSMPNGIIIKYRIRIIQYKINMCTDTNQIVHESYFNDKTEDYVNLEYANKCVLYGLEVTPINGRNINNGLGNSSILPFRNLYSKPSPISLNVKFSSQNSVVLHLTKLHDNAQCQPMGFTVVIINKNNQYDCAVNVFSSTVCNIVKTEFDKICANVSYFPFDNQTTSIKSVFNGAIQPQNAYKYKILLITDQISEINSASIGNEEMSDCFTDCHRKGFPYPGIRSADRYGNICTQWINSAKYSHYKGTKSNICSLYKSKSPWCPTSNEGSWEYCDIPDCSTVHISTGCVSITATESNTESLKINWSSPGDSDKIIGYIILLHNTDHNCEQYQIQMCDTCQSEGSFTNRVKNLYLSCKSGRSDLSIRYEMEFKGLHQNQQYILYILPVISVDGIGEVKTLTIRTKLARPDVPQNVRVISKSLSKIELTWDKPNDFRKHGKPDHYLVEQNRDTMMHEKVQEERIKVSNLEMCTKYCYQVRSVNDAGASEGSKEDCWFTLAPRPDQVAIGEIQSRYLRDQTISWKYLGSDKCAKEYRLEYSIKYKQDASQSKSTNETRIELNNLTPNVNYTVKVTAESLMETMGNAKIGPPSESKEFYTGLVDLNATYYNEHIDIEANTLNISWAVAEEARGSIFEFIIILKNSSKICNDLVHFQCSNCPSPWKWEILQEEKKTKRIKLLKCSNILYHSYGSNEISFNHIIKSKNKLSNFSVEIYAINLIGVHQLNEKVTIMNEPKQGKSSIIIIALSLIIFCIIIIIIIMKKKTDYLSFNKKENKRNDSAIPFNQINESNNMSRSNISDENNVKNRTSELSNNPKLYNKKKSKPINVCEFEVYYERMIMNKSEELIKEYKKLGFESKNIEAKLKFTFDVGKDSHNAKKNRFVNILPFDQNRVKIGEKGSPFDYINASYIPFKDDDEKIEYIASQGPIDDSLSDFWQMIWEQNINYIIMLTQTMEGDKFKCLQYWPDEIGETATFGSNNQYNVKLMEEKDEGGHIERVFHVINQEINVERNIMHLHMHTWFDHSAPDLNYFDKLLFRFQEKVISDATYPYLIHCSAGVGRTGTLICLDRIIKELVAGFQEINIYETVLKLRHYRNFIVQRQAQYIFIHDYINHFISKYMKIENEEMLYFNEDQENV